MNLTTLAESSMFSMEIKKSKFIGRAIPLLREKDSDLWLEKIRTEERGAAHHCFAWRFGLDRVQERYSDDGEPSGTAGRPILDVIRRQQLNCLLVVVTRYFGGTLLGANGLVRAYTEAAAGALQAAVKMALFQATVLEVTLPYSDYGRLEYALHNEGVHILESDFTDNVRLRLLLSLQDSSQWQAAIQEWTAGRATIHLSPPVWAGRVDHGELRLENLPQGL
ncbi:IMPACT family protein [Alicyclobacillus tolerans]|uniref:Uncharacterized protein, YigZ family n=1 Tax=Alicyclobacillus tolerans TaxID=90970 RepID=A0A1M6TF56_9BACL|nr:YigZ family protein [Alicyclobacillus montanus]SHK55590.1 uncharacterized protein, YigZ family [Alicyclobacillus montanus]